MRAFVIVGLTALLVSGCASSAATTSEASIAGRVLSAPSCPVEQAGVPCPARPVAGAAVVALRDGHVLATARTNTRGYFHLTVAPGRYTVQATNAGGYQSTASKIVTVAADKAIFVRLVVDSGIR